MKLCPKCGLEKDDKEFGFHRKRGKRILQYWCKLCQKEYKGDHYKSNKPAYLAKAARHKALALKRNRTLLWQYYKTHPCVDCGEDDPVVLHSDHVRGKKESEISKLLPKASWERIQRELAKCQTRCANCHVRRTARQFGWHKNMRQRRQSGRVLGLSLRAIAGSSPVAVTNLQGVLHGADR